MTEPKHRKCARVICENERTAEGDHRYCSAECKRISYACNRSGGRAVPAREEWSWLPRQPGEVRIAS